MMVDRETVINLVAAMLCEQQYPTEWAGDDYLAWLCPSTTVCTSWVLDMLEDAFDFAEKESTDG